MVQSEWVRRLLHTIVLAISRTIDARKISLEALGKYFPNSPMLAAIVKVSGVMDDEAFLAEMQKSYAHKFASKPEVIEGNMKALSLALQEVQ